MMVLQVCLSVWPRPSAQPIFGVRMISLAVSCSPLAYVSKSLPKQSFFNPRLVSVLCVFLSFDRGLTKCVFSISSLVLALYTYSSVNCTVVLWIYIPYMVE